MDKTVAQVLDQIADRHEFPDSVALNIRVDGAKLERHNTKDIEIRTKTDKDGIDVFIAPGSRHGSVHIPVVLTRSGFKDLVYNDFYVGEGAECEIIAGCGINNCGCDDSQHDGVHTFHVGKNAHVIYREKHYGEGSGTGRRILNPKTVLYLEEGSSVTLDTSQIRGVDDTKRMTEGHVGAGAELIIQEKLLTHENQKAESEMEVYLEGAGARTRVISRSVAKDHSEQVFYPRVTGLCECFGHVSCDAIIMGSAKVSSIPAIVCDDVDASLIHEAAIGRIAGEQILKLMTLGLDAEQAEEKILEGFLR